MTRRTIPYPCVGYCIIDARGYCVACGRPPNLGLPESCATHQPKKQGEPAEERSPTETPASR